jgi:hypothetical protein
LKGRFRAEGRAYLACQIRCDRATPCSSCKTLGISCGQGGSRANTPQREAVRTSSSTSPKTYELLERISTLEKSLLRIAEASEAASRTQPANQTTQVATQVSPSAVPVFEGQSSFNSATRLARDAAYSAVAACAGTYSDLNVSAALVSLKNSLDEQSQSPSAVQGPNLSTVNLLPATFVVALVKRTKVKPPFYLVCHSLHDHVQLESLCRKIYFPSEPIPSGSTTLLYGLLYYIIRDYLHEKDPDLSAFDCDSYARICQRQFDLEMESFEAWSNPTLEKVQAMLIAVSRFGDRWLRRQDH